MVYRKAGDDSNYNTALYIQNLDAAGTANVTIKSYNTDGTLKCTVNDTIALLSSKGYWTPGVGCLTNGWQGSAIITADRDIAAIGRPHFGSEVYAYNGFTGGGLTGYVPMLFSYGFGGSYNASLYLQNIDPTDTAGITIKLYDTAGNLSCTINDSLAPLATVDLWVPDILIGCPP
jgi:hypothetical protein